MNTKKTKYETDIGLQLDQFTMRNIFINSKKEEWVDDIISYEQLCLAVFHKPTKSATIQYSRGFYKDQGTLIDGQIVKVKNGMVFDVTITNSA